jgi:hypothetical protein
VAAASAVGEEGLEGSGRAGWWAIGEGPGLADERDDSVEAGVDLVARHDGLDRRVVQLPRG